MLGLEANRTVTADQLIDGLWGEHAPASAAKMVQGYVWRLRSLLREDSGAEILTHGRGYELRIDPDAVDARRFERLVAEADDALVAGQPGGAAREGLALWRGPALSDVAGEPFAAPVIRRLEDAGLMAAEPEAHIGAVEGFASPSSFQALCAVEGVQSVDYEAPAEGEPRTCRGSHA